MRGGCSCGSVAWKGEGEGDLVHHCHCGMCRKTTGSAFVTMGGFDAARFRFTRRGEITRYRSSATAVRCFCARCGSWVPDEPTGEHAWVTFGSLDDDPGGRPTAHIFVASKAPWLEIRDDLPRFDAYPEGFAEPDLLPRPARVATPGRIGGSCLCGAIAFDFAGPVDFWHHCHCSRCRRASGAAHESTIAVALERFAWLAGERAVASFKLPQAERFTQTFCATCGAKVPMPMPAVAMVRIPAGSLDDDPGSGPQRHIFVGSKAPWDEIGDDLPRFDGYPT